MNRKWLLVSLILIVASIFIFTSNVYSETAKAYATVTVIIPPRPSVQTAENKDEKKADKEETYEEAERIRFAKTSQKEEEE